jgi:integral membrane protein (TIGR01906 family)
MNRVITWLAALLVPFALVGLALRLLLTPLFLQIEYRLPGFPPDSYGFTQADRLHWAPYAVDYLTNAADIAYLADLTFEDGSPLFNDRELSHMLDVKILTRIVLRLWRWDLGLLALLGLGSWLTARVPAYRLGLSRGGWLTVGLVAAVLLSLLVDFTALFTQFHRLFFEGDTWLFLYSDTLIRLFPMRFWQDCFIFTGLFSLAGGLGLALGLRRKTSQ